MKLPTPAEMAALEQHAQSAYGISVAALMERAGACTAAVARDLLRTRPGRQVVVLVGKGNNGGDGLVAARHLAGESQLRVVLTAPAEDFHGEPALHLAAVRDLRLPLRDAQTLGGDDLDRTLREADLVVDAIFGTGFRGPAEGVPARVIEAANRSATPILAVDVPSGIDAATGRADPPCISATATVTMGLPKIGLVQFPAAAHVGRLFVADIGFPEALLQEAPIQASLVLAPWVDGTIPRRSPDSHKGQFGRVAVIAGARGFAGAAVLAARGAIRAGAGLVTVGLPFSLATVLPAALPEAMTRPLPETDAGTLSESAYTDALEFAAAATAVALGPGLTTHPQVVALLRRLLGRLERPVVLDADGLNAFAGEPERLRDAPGPVVVTPHPGEMARLFGTTVEEVQRDRPHAAREGARATGGIVVLKGARTVVAAPDGRTAIVPRGNAGMATGGMGDVLTGVIVSFLGQGLPPFEAAASGAYLHGLAGDLAAAEWGEAGLLAHDVADEIPRALAKVRAGVVDDGVSRVA